MTLQPGDRVRWATTADDGLPLVRYGFIGTQSSVNGHVQVMFDGDLNTTAVVPVDDLVLVSITAIELRIAGCDLLDDPTMRQGLVHLWSAEADEAGLEVASVTFVASRATSYVTANAPIALAEVHSGGQHYVLQARALAPIDTISVRAASARP